MIYIMGILASAGWYVLGARIVGWFRVRLAEHRRRLSEAGYDENNVGRRLRGDRYIRIGSLVFIVFNGLVWVGIRMSLPAMMPSLGQFIICAVFSPMVAFIPAMATYQVVKFLGEFKEPKGDVALDLRDKQWHVRATPIDPNKGELGNSKILDAVKQGFTNPASLVFPRRHIVSEGTR